MQSFESIKQRQLNNCPIKKVTLLANNKSKTQILPSDLLCYICQQYFVKPITAFCGHSFCQYCLEQYYLFTEFCPVCDEEIRNKTSSPCLALGGFVQNFIKEHGHKQDQMNYEKRKELIKQYKFDKQLKEMKAGIKVDIRDDNYIWCQGLVIRMISRVGEHQKYMKINYINYMDTKEEDLKVTSDRLAHYGFYTKRNDLPFYQNTSQKDIIREKSFYQQ